MQHEYDTMISLHNAGLVSSQAATQAICDIAGISPQELDHPQESEPTQYCSSKDSLKVCPFCGVEEIKLTKDGQVRCLGCGCCYMYVTERDVLPDYVLEDHQTCDGCLDLFPNSALWDMPDIDGNNHKYCDKCIVEVRCLEMADSIEHSLETESNE